jgi:hypothetical protein
VRSARYVIAVVSAPGGAQERAAMPVDVNVVSPCGARLGPPVARRGWLAVTAAREARVTLRRSPGGQRNSPFRVWPAVAIRGAGA